MIFHKKASGQAQRTHPDGYGPKASLLIYG